MKHIKRILSVMAVLFVSLTMSAQQISESEAKSRAMQFFSKNSTRNKVKGKVAQQQTVQTYKASSVINCDTLDLQGAEPFYVVQSSGEGFVIVGGDERMESILAYSDDGVFDSENIPEQVSGWLTRYAKEMKVLSNSKVQASDDFFQLKDEMAYSLPIKSGGVSPLLGNVRWGQEEPYNNMCPLDGNYRSVTGCVATSGAQIMHYYKHPERGTGSRTIKLYFLGGEASADFSQSIYDWDNMLDTYDGDYTTEQASAVAQLMYDVGIAVKMGYNGSRSGTDRKGLTDGLPKYLGYDKDMSNVLRKGLSETDWERLLLKQLNNSHPVEYSDGGHSFVLDGYSVLSDSERPYYHMNFGYPEKNYDGYYQISSIKVKHYKENGEIDYIIDYNSSSSEAVTCNFYPEDGMDGDAFISVIPSPSLPEYIVNDDEEQTRSISVKFENLAYATRAFEGKIALYAKRADGRWAVQLTEPISVKIEPESSVYYESIDITYPSYMTPGLYYYDWVYVWNDEEMSPDADGLLKENKKMLYLYEDMPDLSLQEVSPISNPINPSKPLELSVEIYNFSYADYYGPIYAIFTQPSTGVVDTLTSKDCHIPRYSSKTIDISGYFTNFAASNVTLKFAYEPESGYMQYWGKNIYHILPFTTNLTSSYMYTLTGQDSDSFTLVINGLNNLLDVPFEGDLQMLLTDEYGNGICQFGPIYHFPNSSTPMLTYNERDESSIVDNRPWIKTTCSLPSGLPEGNYRIYVVASQLNSGTWQRMKKESKTTETPEELYISFTLEGGEVTISDRTHITYESTAPSYAFNHIIINSTGNGRVVSGDKEIENNEDRILAWNGKDCSINIIPEDYAYPVVTIDGEPYETPLDGTSLVLRDVQAGHTVNVTFNYPSGDINGDGIVDVEDVANLVAKLEREENYTVDLDLNLNNKLDKEDVELMVDMDLTGKGIEEVMKKKNIHYHHQHQYVDLGLSVKWATCNVGANSPEEPGDYFAWGETEPYYIDYNEDELCYNMKDGKSGYNWESYKWMIEGESSEEHITKYTFEDQQTSAIWYEDGVFVGDYNDTLEPEDDAAHVNWGGNWRMPTEDELEELVHNCYWERTENYNNTGMDGYIVYKAKTDADKGTVKSGTESVGTSYSLKDAHIFLPHTGEFQEDFIRDSFGDSSYWSSSLTSSSNVASKLYFYGTVGTYEEYRFYGCSIRPVCP